MKKLMFLLLPLVVFLASCNGGQTENKEKDAAEIKAADSLTTEMDNLQGEMETLGSELDDAVNALEPKK
jgi:DNA anti-recombination protein RmuC